MPLRDNRDRAPLFNSPLYARHIEAAFAHMVEIADAGSSPQPFAVSG